MPDFFYQIYTVCMYERLQAKQRPTWLNVKIYSYVHIGASRVNKQLRDKDDQWRSAPSRSAMSCDDVLSNLQLTFRRCEIGDWLETRRYRSMTTCMTDSSLSCHAVSSSNDHTHCQHAITLYYTYYHVKCTDNTGPELISWFRYVLTARNNSHMVMHSSTNLKASFSRVKKFFKNWNKIACNKTRT